jgi:hypothetical protein
MPRRKIANWTTIRNMCRRRFATQTAEELAMQAMELGRHHAEDEVVAFEREGKVAQAARVLEDASAVFADVAVGKMHTCAARKVVETVAMEAAIAALRAMRNDPAMVSLEAVAMEATKVAVRSLRVARQASVEAQMYGDDATDEESRVAATAVVAAGTTAWRLLDGDETEVEDDDDEKAEAAAEAQRDVELRAAAAEAERVKTAAEEERVKAAVEEEAEAAEQAAHWEAEMDKALAYRRDVDRDNAARWDAACRVETERLAGRCADFDHLIERCMTVRRQEAAIYAAMAAIEAADFGGNSDRGALQ